MDKPIAEIGGTLREKALAAIDATRFVPRAGYNRLRSMIETRPDWCVSRQRAWGVPIAVFVDKADRRAVARSRGHGPRRRGLQGRGRRRLVREPARALPRQQVQCRRLRAGEGHPRRLVRLRARTHAFTLEGNPDLKWPADLYLEGSDQHRGWFHSSLLESCGTRGRAPYDGVLTHGFTLDEQGRKMSKSLGNVTAPQGVCDQYGADILRLWVVGTDYTEDQRIGPEILKHQAEAYRRLRNTLRYLLGSLEGFSAAERVEPAEMPELERWVLHRLAELDVDPAQGGRRLRLPHHRHRAATLSARAISRPSTSTSARTRSTATRRRAAAPPRGAHGDGRGLLVPDRVAGADHLLHRRRGVAAARPRTCRTATPTACTCALPRDPGGLARRRAGREVEDRARAAPRRDRRARTRTRREAHRVEPAGGAACPCRAGICRCAEGPRSRRDLHHLGRRSGGRRARRPAPSPCRTWRASAVVPALARGRRNARAAGRFWKRSASRPSIR